MGNVTVSDHAFWSWALQMWRQPELEATLLQWQERHGVSILALLFVVWLAREDKALSVAQIEDLHKAIDPWVRDVVLPLRICRQQWREQPALSSLRPRLAQLELRAEQELAALCLNWLEHQPPMARGAALAPQLENFVIALQLKPTQAELDALLGCLSTDV